MRRDRAARGVRMSRRGHPMDLPSPATPRVCAGFSTNAQMMARESLRAIRAARNRLAASIMFAQTTEGVKEEAPTRHSPKGIRPVDRDRLGRHDAGPVGPGSRNRTAGPSGAGTRSDSAACLAARPPTALRRSEDGRVPRSGHGSGPHWAGRISRHGQLSRPNSPPFVRGTAGGGKNYRSIFS
jgi:hypothetical protein